MLHSSSLPTQAHVSPASRCRLPAHTCSWTIGHTRGKIRIPHMQQWTMPEDWRSVRSMPCPPAITTRSESALFRHPGELDLNMREYMVVLEKPVGLTLAPDPRTGQVVIQDIKPNSPAYKCGLIQVGDVVKSCSAVFGDEMWVAADIRRVRWAINSRMGDVKLLMERGRRSAGSFTAWYCGGKAGVATRERDGMQLPYTFNGIAVPDETTTLIELPGAGRTMQIAFHRNTITQPPSSRRAAAAAAARNAALQRLRRELSDVRSMRPLDLEAMRRRSGGPDGFMLPPTASSVGARSSGGGGGDVALSSRSPGSDDGSGGGGGLSPPPPVVEVVAPAPPNPAADGAGNGASNGNGNGGGGGGGLLSGLKLGGGGGTIAQDGAAPASTGVTADANGDAAKKKKVATFLPWLLVTCGRIEHRDIATIASSRSLGAILELSLTRAQQPQQSPQSQQTGSSPIASAAAATEAAATSGNSSNDGSSSSSSSKPAGGYLVVRGADLVPQASDVGRVSYQALLAAARIAATPNGGGGGSAVSSSSASPLSPPSSLPLPPPTPLGEDPPPPPPGSAAATAVMINGADVVAADGSSLVTSSLTDAATGSSGATVADGSGGGGKTSNDGVRDGANGNGNSNGGGLGSSTMALLNRSIFLNFRPSMPFASAAAKAMNPVFSSAPSSAPSSGSPMSPPANGPSIRPTFSALPTSRYDPVRVRHLLNAAASLQRLAFRRGGRLHRARRDSCAVLLHCDSGMEFDVAVLLAGWLHWYGRLPLQEAILASETAMGVTVDQGLLEAGTAALLQGARERCSRVVLTWKYGGLSAYVAGDVVASWSARVPMVRCRSPLGCKGDTHPGHFFLEVQGLRPGLYYYKYIVDGTWAVDSYSSKVLDAAGNWNNVLVVPEPPVVLTSREGLALARWQAARLALEAKMGIMGPPAVQRPI